MPRKKAKEVKEEKPTLYGYRIFFEDGETMTNDPEVHEGPYKSKEEAEEAANEAISLMHQGAEIFHMSNPGDYPEPDYDEEPEIEVFEYDEYELEDF